MNTRTWLESRGPALTGWLLLGLLLTLGSPPAVLAQPRDGVRPINLELMQAELDFKRAELRVVETRLKQALAEHDRLKQLVLFGAVSRVDLERARSAVDMATAELELKKAQVRDAEAVLKQIQPIFESNRDLARLEQRVGDVERQLTQLIMEIQLLRQELKGKGSPVEPKKEGPVPPAMEEVMLELETDTVRMKRDGTVALRFRYAPSGALFIVTAPDQIRVRMNGSLDAPAPVSSSLAIALAVAPLNPRPFPALTAALAPGAAANTLTVSSTGTSGEYQALIRIMKGEKSVTRAIKVTVE
jgi:hypothetical protein